MMLFMQTLLPDPVAPATSVCGILVRSANTASPPLPMPSATGRAELFSNSTNASVSKTERSATLHKAVEVINETEGTDFDPFAALESTAADLLTLIQDEDELAVGQVWAECDEVEQKLLWTAKTKGGWFTMDEKKYIRASVQAYKKANGEDDASN